ncbi:O-antigen ligase family protein [Flavivirga jejuensis]|uniref:O-antigen ligase family protein n=1 Tax=Flavivirga jejuensis TaxID=870487 RepID=A0ABT8WUI6_9FLAO|nr:O-antigen ligase family protein [Flavivirga jejuensis]MDO5976644.1 O-antigen ligase family protein [Flavivirga jejuensis]
MKNLNYIKLIVLHIVIGILIYVLPVLSKVYLIAIFVYFVNAIFKAKPSQKVLQVLIACAYTVGSEVFLRMTGGSFLYETSKYLVIVFCLIGMFNVKSYKQPIPYILYVFLLIPGILVAGFNITEETTIRTAIAFNLSGPVCLGVVAIFFYKRKIAYQDFHKMFFVMALPLIANTTYLFLFTPDIRDVITGTGSNFATSGGFGPNQVSTVLGLGMFVFTIRFFMLSPSLFLKIINGVLLAVVSYRGIVTFSRGGIITALFMIIAFIYFYFKKVNIKSKFRISRMLFVFIALGLLIWSFSSLQTSGFIEKRYANQDALGRAKEDISTGRSNLISFELDEFFKNPILGVGVGKIKELRLKNKGVLAASHNEMSRILSEHGLFGMMALLILLLTPLIFRIQNKSNVFFYSCYFFWFLTINHSSMRIAAPAFLYGLCLLDVKYAIHNTRILDKKNQSRAKHKTSTN